MNNDLLERNFLDTAGTKIKNFGSRLGNAVVAGTGQTFGARATKSNSRLSINIIANELTHNWEKWLTAMRAGGHNVEGDMNDLYRYIEKYFGQEALNWINSTGNPINQTRQQPNLAGGPTTANAPKASGFGQATTPTNTFGKRTTALPTQSSTAPSSAAQSPPPFGLPSAPVFGGTPPARPPAGQPPSQQAPQKPAFNNQPQQNRFGKRTTPHQSSSGLEDDDIPAFLRRQTPLTPPQDKNDIAAINQALQVAKPEQRSAIIANIRNKIAQEPDFLTKHPEFSVFTKTTEARMIKGNLVLIEAELKASEVDVVMKKLAAWHVGEEHLKQRKNNNNNNTTQQSQQQSRQSQGNFSNPQGEKSIITLTNFEKAATNHRIDFSDERSIRNFLKNQNPQQASIEEIKKFIHWNDPSSPGILYRAIRP